VGSYLEALVPETPATGEEGAGDVAIAELWLDDQPRLIVPEEVLARLIGERRSRPADLLAALRGEAERDAYFRDVLSRIETFAEDVRVNGVLVPIRVVRRDDRLIVQDGHRRTLAALVVGLATVPAQIVVATSEYATAAQQLVLNLQRRAMTALETARWLLRLAHLAESEIKAELSLPAALTAVDQWLAAEEDEELAATGRSWRSFSKEERDLARRVQERVCASTSLSTDMYRHHLRLNRLTTEARRHGMSLAEAQLQPLTRLPPEEQAEITVFVAQRNLGAREVGSLVQVVRSGDRDQVRRVMARLAGEASGRRRVTPSWESILYATPKDFEGRCQALVAELHALQPHLRRARLETVREQAVLSHGLARELDEILALFAPDLLALEPAPVEASP
jgi:ParB-like chromosome segregation protein Spo0J